MRITFKDRRSTLRSRFYGVARVFRVSTLIPLTNLDRVAHPVFSRLSFP